MALYGCRRCHVLSLQWIAAPLCTSCLTFQSVTPSRAISLLGAGLQIRADNPGIPITEVSKIIAARWKETDAPSRAPFEAQAAQDKERYKEQMAAYKASQAASPGGGDSDH